MIDATPSYGFRAVVNARAGDNYIVERRSNAILNDAALRVPQPMTERSHVLNVVDSALFDNNAEYDQLVCTPLHAYVYAVV